MQNPHLVSALKARISIYEYGNTAKVVDVTMRAWLVQMCAALLLVLLQARPATGTAAASLDLWSPGRNTRFWISARGVQLPSDERAGRTGRGRMGRGEHLQQSAGSSAGGGSAAIAAVGGALAVLCLFYGAACCKGKHPRCHHVSRANGNRCASRAPRGGSKYCNSHACPCCFGPKLSAAQAQCPDCTEVTPAWAENVAALYDLSVTGVGVTSALPPRRASYGSAMTRNPQYADAESNARAIAIKSTGPSSSPLHQHEHEHGRDTRRTSNLQRSTRDGSVGFGNTAAGDLDSDGLLQQNYTAHSAQDAVAAASYSNLEDTNVLYDDPNLDLTLAPAHRPINAASATTLHTSLVAAVSNVSLHVYDQGEDEATSSDAMQTEALSAPVHQSNSITAVSGAVSSLYQLFRAPDESQARVHDSLPALPVPSARARSSTVVAVADVLPIMSTSHDVYQHAERRTGIDLIVPTSLHVDTCHVGTANTDNNTGPSQAKDKKERASKIQRGRGGSAYLGFGHADPADPATMSPSQDGLLQQNDTAHSAQDAAAAASYSNLDNTNVLYDDPNLEPTLAARRAAQCEDSAASDLRANTERLRYNRVSRAEIARATATLLSVPAGGAVHAGAVPDYALAKLADASTYDSVDLGAASAAILKDVDVSHYDSKLEIVQGDVQVYLTCLNVVSIPSRSTKPSEPPTYDSVDWTASDTTNVKHVDVSHYDAKLEIVHGEGQAYLTGLEPVPMPSRSTNPSEPSEPSQTTSWDWKQ